MRLAVVKVFATMVELCGLTALDEDLHCCGDSVSVVICMGACEIVVCGLSSIEESMAKEILHCRTKSKRARSMLKLTTTIAHGTNDF